MKQVNLATIEQAIEQAVERRSSVRETILSLRKSVLYRFGSSEGDVNERKKHLRQSMSFLEDLLEDSSKQGEAVLSSMPERLIVHGLVARYEDARKELNEVRWLLMDEGLESVTRERLDALAMYVGRRIENVCEGIVHNASAEEMILKTARRALQQQVR